MSLKIIKENLLNNNIVEHIDDVLKLIEELEEYRSMFTTVDGVVVKPNDKVFVFGSTSIQETYVKSACTGYELFGPILVNNSYSTKEAAENGI